MTISRFTSELIESSLQLKPFPSVAVRVLAMRDREGVTPSEITDVVASDPAITAHVLALANSSLYGFSSAVDSLDQAGVRLGVAKLSELCLACATRAHFAPSGYLSHRTLEFLWQRSFVTAQAARRLAQLDGAVSPNAAFTAGLLGELGHLAMHQILSPEVIAAVAQLTLAGQPLCEAEEMVIGVDHATLAGTLLGFWNFPHPLARAVGGHHAPGSDELAACAGLAGRYASTALREVQTISEELSWMLDDPIEIDANDPDAIQVEAAMHAALAFLG